MTVREFLAKLREIAEEEVHDVDRELTRHDIEEIHAAITAFTWNTDAELLGE